MRFAPLMGGMGRDPARQPALIEPNGWWNRSASTQCDSRRSNVPNTVRPQFVCRSQGSCHPVPALSLHIQLYVLIIRVKNEIGILIPPVTWSMEYDIGQNEPVSLAVVRSVAAVEGREPCTLPLLAHVIDTDALDAIFASRSNGQSRTGGRLSFIYSDSRVSIENGEYLTIELLTHRLRSAVDGVSHGDRTR